MSADQGNLNDRAANLVRREVETGTESWWWLSFVGDTREGENAFTGACIVKAHGMVTAVVASHERGCNPGGAVQGTPFPPHVDASEWGNTLLTRADVDRFDDWMNLHYPTGS